MMSYKQIHPVVQICFILVLYFLWSYAFVTLFPEDPLLSASLANTVCIGLFGIYYLGLGFQRQEGLVTLTPTNWIVIVTILSLTWAISQMSGISLYEYKGDDSYKAYSQVMTDPDSLLLLLLPFVLAPVAEELIMRGLIYQLLKYQTKNMYLSATIQAFLFASFHGTLVHLVSGFLAGLVFVFVFEYTGRLRYAIVGHGLYNVMSTMLTGASIPSAFIHPIVIVPGFIGMVLLLYYLIGLTQVDRSLESNWKALL